MRPEFPGCLGILNYMAFALYAASMAELFLTSLFSLRYHCIVCILKSTLEDR